VSVAASRTLREDARLALSDWQAPTAEQFALQRDYVAHLDAHENAVDRACSPDHITVSALVFSADFTRVALLFHPKFDRWLQMGGHCEPGDSSLAAGALREAYEETGLASLAIDPDPVVLSRHEVKCWPGGHHLDVQFMAVVAPDDNGVVNEELVCSHESTAIRWFPVEDVASVSDESVVDLVTFALDRLDIHRNVTLFTLK